jgi:hypothetical protein
VAKDFLLSKNTIEVDLINLPPYVNVPPTEMKNWTFNPKNMLNTINALHRVMGELATDGLTLEDIIAYYISQQVSPL